MNDTLENYSQLDKSDKIVWLIYRRGVVEGIFKNLETAIDNARTTDNIIPRIVENK